MSRDFYTIRFAGRNDIVFKLSSSTLRTDSPNFFTAAFFTSNLIESRSRELLLDRCPELFQIIVDHLRGYKVLPLIPASLPKRMTLGNAYHNLLADAQFYQLNDLTKQLKLVMKKAGTKSDISLKRITFVDEDMHMRAAINLRDIRTTDIEFRSLGGGNSKVLALNASKLDNCPVIPSEPRPSQCLRPIELHAQNIQLSLDIHARNHQVEFDMIFKLSKDNFSFDIIKQLDPSNDWRPHGKIREFELPYTALEIDDIVFTMQDLVDLPQYVLEKLNVSSSSSSSTILNHNNSNSSVGPGSPQSKYAPTRSYSPQIPAPIPVNGPGSDTNLPYFLSQRAMSTSGVSTTPPPPSTSHNNSRFSNISSERAARLDALIDRVGPLIAIDFVQLHADEVIFMVGNWSRGSTARLLKVRARTFRNHAMDHTFFPPIAVRRRILSEEETLFKYFPDCASQSEGNDEDIDDEDDNDFKVEEDDNVSVSASSPLGGPNYE